MPCVCVWAGGRRWRSLKSPRGVRLCVTRCHVPIAWRRFFFNIFFPLPLGNNRKMTKSSRSTSCSCPAHFFLSRKLHHHRHHWDFAVPPGTNSHHQRKERRRKRTKRIRRRRRQTTTTSINWWCTLPDVFIYTNLRVKASSTYCLYKFCTVTVPWW